EGDLYFPDVISYLQSAVRVEDGIYRMTRERAVLYIADTHSDQARGVLERLQDDFWAEYANVDPPSFEFRYFSVKPDCAEITVKDVLKSIFASGPSASIH
ncbi:MAG: hypothetical protein V3T33_09275, partial [Myxococcota bacterium]